MLFFYIQQKYYLRKILCFSKLYYCLILGLQVNGVSVTPISQVCVCAMSLLMSIEV
jgi:hypothetical protein